MEWRGVGGEGLSCTVETPQCGQNDRRTGSKTLFSRKEHRWAMKQLLKVKSGILSCDLQQ